MNQIETYSKKWLVCKSDVEVEIAKCFVFMNKDVEPTQIVAMAKEIQLAFPKVAPERIMEAIKKGYTGEYGRSYGLNLQEICLWIRCYTDNKKPKDYERSLDEL